MNNLLHRKILKWLHWLSAGLILYFVFVEPDLPNRGASAAKTAALSTHAGMGAVLGLVVLLWTLLFVLKGEAGRPSPRLQGWQHTTHRILNRGLYFVLPIFMLTGMAVGLAAPFLVTAFGLLPLNFPSFGSDDLHRIAEETHETAFDVLLYAVIAHAAFHIWRHFWMRDNALRIMAPKFLDKYL